MQVRAHLDLHWGGFAVRPPEDPPRQILFLVLRRIRIRAPVRLMLGSPDIPDDSRTTWHQGRICRDGQQYWVCTVEPAIVVRCAITAIAIAPNGKCRLVVERAAQAGLGLPVTGQRRSQAKAATAFHAIETMVVHSPSSRSNVPQRRATSGNDSTRPIKTACRSSGWSPHVLSRGSTPGRRRRRPPTVGR